MNPIFLSNKEMNSTQRIFRVLSVFMSFRKIFDNSRICLTCLFVDGRPVIALDDTAVEGVGRFAGCGAAGPLSRHRLYLRAGRQGVRHALCSSHRRRWRRGSGPVHFQRWR